MEYLLFPKKTYYLTQGYGINSFSHQYRKALDVSSRGGNTNIYAPFTGYVAKIFIKNNCASTIWLVSSNKILCADGNMHYVVAMFTHPNDISKYKVNDKFKQNQLILHDGTTGNVKAHLDFEIAIYSDKKLIRANWHKTKNGYALDNAVNPCSYMLLDDKTNVINEYYKVQNKYYHFKSISDITKNIKYKTLYNMYIRKNAGINSDILLVKNLSKDGQKNATSKNKNSKALYKKGTIFTVKNFVKLSDNSLWARSPSGYICIKDNKTTYCKKV